MYAGRLKKDVITVIFRDPGRLELKEVEETPCYTKYSTEKHGFVRYHKSGGLWTFEKHAGWVYLQKDVTFVTTAGRYNVAI